MYRLPVVEESPAGSLLPELSSVSVPGMQMKRENAFSHTDGFGGLL